MIDHPADPSQQEVSAGDHAGGPRHARHGEADGPLDLSALRADDELLTALSPHHHSMADPDQEPELKSLLLSWRLDVDAPPIPELVDTETALRAIEAGVRNQRRRPKYMVPLASAAAVLVIVFAGMSLAARDAHPGDALWGLSEVLYADHARSVEAAALVRDDLTHATLALAKGHLSEARHALDAAQASLPSVDESDGKAGLQTQQQTLLSQLNATTSQTSPVPTPPPTSVPVVAPAATTTETPTPTTTTTTPPPPTTTTPPPTTTTPPPTSTSSQPQSQTLSPQQQGSNGPTGTNQNSQGDQGPNTTTS